MALKRISIGLAAIALGSAAIAVAATPADFIATRQQNYKKIGGATKAIMDELRKSAPSADVFKANAAILDSLSPKIPGWFPKGTGPEAGVKTAALPAIWTDPAGFKNAAAGFVGATHALKAAAATGDAAKVRAAMGGLSKACRTCHESFKAR